MSKRKAGALDYVYATYQIDREELEVIAVLKTIEPATDLVTMCDTFADVTLNIQDEPEAMPKPSALCPKCVATIDLTNAVSRAVKNGTPRATIEKVITDMIQDAINN